jgi:DNA-binding SARP family transcriptional activator
VYGRIGTYDLFVLEVRLLGGLEAEARGKLLPVPAHPQGLALLAWLALHPGEHSRGPVAALLWPGVPHANARTSLRSAAWALRRALGPDERLVLSGRETIGLRCATDLQAFERHLAAGEPTAALALCRGPLLAGLEEHAWVRAARAAHERRVAAVRAQVTAQ